MASETKNPKTGDNESNANTFAKFNRDTGRGRRGGRPFLKGRQVDPAA